MKRILLALVLALAVGRATAMPLGLRTAVWNASTANGNGGTVLPPNPPTDVAATTDRPDGILVSWSGGSGAAFFNVWRGTSDVRSSAAKIGICAASPFFDGSSLVDGQTYHYWIEAVNSTGSAYGDSAIGRKKTGGPDPAIVTPDFGFCADWESPLFLATTPEATSGSTSFKPLEPIYLHFLYVNLGQKTLSTPFYIWHVLEDGDGNRIGSWRFHETNTVASTHYRYWHRYLWPPLQNLAPGNYAYWVLLDADGDLDETDTGNNYARVEFTVEATQSPVTFDRQGGSGGTAGVTATYGSAMPAIDIPARTDYEFGGYFSSTNGTGTQYYTAAGESARNWDRTIATTLYAKWTYLGNSAIAAAVDNGNLKFTTGGNANWFVANVTTHDGESGTAARSGRIGNNQGSVLTATCSGTGIVSFWWKVSSEKNYDFVLFYVDGVCKMLKSGTDEGWRHEAFKVGEGSHTFVWYYVKDKSYASGSDCAWVDQVKWAANSPVAPIYRFYSPNYRGHFFTIDESEMHDVLNNANWNYEGVAYFAYPSNRSGMVALHRFYSKKYRGHFFTINEEEMRTVRNTNPNWKYEGVAYYVYPQKVEGSVPVHRFWSKRYRHHFYTINEAEKDDLIAHNPNWAYENVAFWAIPAAATEFAVVPDEVNAECRMLDAECVMKNDIIAANAANGGKEWTLRAEDGTAVAVRGVTEADGALVETRGDAPYADELESHAEAAEIVSHAEFAESAVFESHAESAEFAESGSPAGGAGERSEPEGVIQHSAFSIQHFSLSLPSGLWRASLWSAADGPLTDEDAEGAFDFNLPTTGVWHWLRVRDAADEDADDTYSLWLRAE